MEKDRVFIRGNAKAAPFSKPGNTVINLSLNIDDLTKHAEKGYVRVVVAERRNGADAYNNTHYVYINDFVPDKTKVAKKASAPKAEEKGPDALPF